MVTHIKGATSSYAKTSGHSKLVSHKKKSNNKHLVVSNKRNVMRIKLTDDVPRRRKDTSRDIVAHDEYSDSEIEDDTSISDELCDHVIDLDQMRQDVRLQRKETKRQLIEATLKMEESERDLIETKRQCEETERLIEDTKRYFKVDRPSLDRAMRENRRRAKIAYQYPEYLDDGQYLDDGYITE